MKKQKVVRTRAFKREYEYEDRAMNALSELLAKGWIVVMCNPIRRGTFEWLEYIVEKDDGVKEDA